MAKFPYQDTIVLVGVFGVVGVIGAWLYSQFQSGSIAASAPSPMADPGMQAMAAIAESEVHPEVGIDPMGYNHIPLQVLGPAEPLDFSMMNFTGSYQKANCADPIRTYF
jgi:hypothetical protein